MVLTIRAELDVLDTFKTIKVAVAYKDASGKELDYFPADLGHLEKCEVVYKEFEGWQSATTAVKTFDDLPKQAQAYVKFIEEYTGVPIKWIGTGRKCSSSSLICWAEITNTGHYSVA